MSASVNTGSLRTLSPDAVRTELEALRAKTSDATVTEQLLGAIERDSLPTSAFATWLGVCKSPAVVERSLRQKTSVRIRNLGIKQLKNGFRSEGWAELWDGMGGTAGLLDILSDLSVLEVRAMCKAIGYSGRTGDDEKRAQVTELFKGLHPDSFPDAKTKTLDSRPLTRYYQALVPSCTRELVNRITAPDQKKKWQYVRERSLLEQHSSDIGRTTIRSIFESEPPDIKSKDRLKALSTRISSAMTPEPRFTASMAFALDLLREIVKNGTRHVENEWVIENLVRPLFRRGTRKHISWSKMQEITALTLRYLEQNRSAAMILTNAKGDVLHMIALCWSRRSTLFEVQLRVLLKAIFCSTTRLEDFANLLAQIPKSRRYSLLRLCCQEVMGVDLDVESGLQRIRGPLTPGLLHDIGASHALGLFRRLRCARGDSNLVEPSKHSSVLATTRALDVYEGDPDIYYLVLLNRNGLYEDAESYAASILEARKKITKTSADRETRAEHALSVWAYANASGSLRLLSETLQWAASFVRDQLTALKLFSTYFDETYKTLSGFLTCGKETLSVRKLRQRVEDGNAVMIALLNVACSALREPFFRSSDWHKTIDVFTCVVNERIELAADVQKAMKASDEDMYYALWEDTIATLLQAENLVNQEEYEKLGASSALGIATMNLDFKGARPNMAGKPIWSFIDNLAKARNDLWTKLRPARYPDVLTLPEPFPQGLPVQYLVAHWTPNIANLQDVAPYISSRVEAAVFVEPELALKLVPYDEPTLQAIGPFVDDYHYALRAYIPDACDLSEKEMRLRKAWNHATGVLSGRRMDPKENHRYWKQLVPSYLRPVLSEIQPKRKHESWPVLPKTDNPSESQEWNPLEGRPSDMTIEARSLGKPTYVDFTTLDEASRPVLWSPHQLPIPQVPPENITVGSIWDYSSRTDTETEAGALAALLYIDAKYGSAERLLVTPFPSFYDVRYPCLYLDEIFLSQDKLNVIDAAAYVFRHTAVLPLLLVQEMTRKLVRRLGLNENLRTLNEAAFTLIQALSQSDRPALTYMLAAQVIIEQPNASSWHRILFHNGFLQRLSASDARNCLSTFTKKVWKKLDTQELDAQSEAGAWQWNKHNDLITSKEDAPQAYRGCIKITTLKLLAQVLKGSGYITHEFSLQILTDLSKKISNIDVKVSILRTLLSKLDANRPELLDRIFSALEPFIPLAGSLNEREPMTDSDWTHAEETLTIPSVQLMTRPAWQEESPLLDAILQCFLNFDSAELAELYLKRILLPVIDMLKQQTARWAKLFLRKHAPEHIIALGASLPPVPRGVTILQQFLKKSSPNLHYVLRILLDEYVAYMVFRINPSAPFLALNKSLKSEPALESTSEVRTWLELYGNEVEILCLYGLPFNRISSFDDQQYEDENVQISRQAFQDAFITLFEALLWADSPEYKQLGVFISSLMQPDNLTRPWWKNYGRPTIKAMLAYVNKIRTREWEADSYRKPAVLPDTFLWEMLLLSYPLNHLAYEENLVREQACKEFANELATVLDHISNSMYHTKLAQIKDYVCNSHSSRNANIGSNLMLSAVYLGDISSTRLSWLTTPELLKVDLAADMMLKAKSMNNIALEVRLKRVLQSWIASENEGVRKMGYRVQGELFDKDGSWKVNASW